MSNLDKNRRPVDGAPAGDRLDARGHEVLCATPPAEINLVIDGVELVLETCSDCGYRSWRRGDEPVLLRDVLADLSNADSRYRHELSARSPQRRRRGENADRTGHTDRSATSSRR